jgi:hypothetical protein
MMFGERFNSAGGASDSKLVVVSDIQKIILTAEARRRRAEKRLTAFSELFSEIFNPVNLVNPVFIFLCAFASLR